MKIYGYDYAGYFTGEIKEIGEDEGYNPNLYVAMEPPPVPEGSFAMLDLDFKWAITDKERPIPIPSGYYEEVPAGQAPEVL